MRKIKMVRIYAFCKECGQDGDYSLETYRFLEDLPWKEVSDEEFRLLRNYVDRREYVILEEIPGMQIEKTVEGLIVNEKKRQKKREEANLIAAKEKAKREAKREANKKKRLLEELNADPKLKKELLSDLMPRG
jgi:hypothetical protein